MTAIIENMESEIANSTIQVKNALQLSFRTLMKPPRRREILKEQNTLSNTTTIIKHKYELM